jgi:hypothetical protein
VSTVNDISTTRLNAPARAGAQKRPGPIAPQSRTQEGARDERTVIWPAVLLFYATMIPPEVHVDISTMRIYAYRALLIFMTPAIVNRIARGKLKLGWVDLFVLLSASWFIVSMTAHYGLSRGLEQGGALSLDLLMAFLLARCYVPDLPSLRRLLELGCWAVALAGGSMMLESISGHLLVRPTLAKLFGADQSAGLLRLDFRMGFLRAFGPFPHPILAGLQMSSMIPLYGFIARRDMRRMLGLGSAFLGLFSFSSAALIGTATNLMLMFYEQSRRRVRELNWPLVAWTVAAVLLILQLVTENGALSVIIRYLTLDPSTGRYRLWIWQYGWDNIVSHPLFGVGRESWERPSYMVSESIDAHWLWLAVRYGAPATITLLAAAVGTIFLLTRKVNAMPESRERTALVGIFISLFMLLLLMFTVTLWSNSMAWLVMLMGMAVSIAQSTQVQDLAPRRATLRSRRLVPRGPMRSPRPLPGLQAPS